MKYMRTVPIPILLCICFAGCGSRDNGSANLTEEQNRAKTQLESQMKPVAETNRAYHAMNNATLLQRLMEQSKAQQEPFNSLAYRELKTRTNVESRSLVPLVKANDNATGLLPLLLLRKLDNKSYLEVPAKNRAKILTDALQGSKYFNTWGLPDFYLEDASRALIEASKSALPALKRMLGETRPAPLFGSKEYMLYKRYQYRLCDYALFFLGRIEGNAEFQLPMSVEERNAEIKKLTAK
jgi:hypothetical protein